MKRVETAGAVLWETVVGSHIWGMDHPGSDTDVFRVYLAPSRDFLTGMARRHERGRQHTDEDTRTDVASCELGHVVAQLLKGNVNHVWGVLSPIVLATGAAHERLKELTERNLSKATFGSVNGLARHNLRRFELERQLPEWKARKKANLIARTLRFGITLLREGRIEFEAVEVGCWQDCYGLLDELAEALTASPLPDKVDAAPFREFLLEVRLGELHGRLPTWGELT